MKLREKDRLCKSPIFGEVREDRQRNCRGNSLGIN